MCIRDSNQASPKQSPPAHCQYLREAVSFQGRKARLAQQKVTEATQQRPKRRVMSARQRMVAHTPERSSRAHLNPQPRRPCHSDARSSSPFSQCTAVLRSDWDPEMLQRFEHHFFEIPLERSSQERSTGNTLMHLACARGAKKVVSFLLDQDCDLNAQNALGDTALHMCYDHGHRQLASVLEKAGADPRIRNHAGGTAGSEQESGACSAVNLRSMLPPKLLKNLNQSPGWCPKKGSKVGVEEPAADALLMQQYAELSLIHI
eukprot:TRINITY_DN13647_c0_g1_i1.p1 TRINITY_DN13647_c0_g1~~TRINITY_DN13647_c0_g1_i1.p1  ORF type:complete len:261 (-),score=49.57 TRINITY_DN13647_c0_g1_i1:127-909(-)